MALAIDVPQPKTLRIEGSVLRVPEPAYGQLQKMRSRYDYDGEWLHAATQLLLSVGLSEDDAVKLADPMRRIQIVLANGDET